MEGRSGRVEGGGSSVGIVAESRALNGSRPTPFMNCHPERSEGSAVRRKMQIPRVARDYKLLIGARSLAQHRRLCFPFLDGIDVVDEAPPVHFFPDGHAGALGDAA